MFVDRIRLNFLQAAWLVLCGALLVRLVRNRYGCGLNKIPGPVLASFSDVWRFVNVWGRRPDVTHIQLHERYGDVVRIGPNTVSISDPKAVQIVYRLNSGLTKSDF